MEWSTLGKELSGRDTRNYNQHAGKLVGESIHQFSNFFGCHPLFELQYLIN